MVSGAPLATLVSKSARSPWTRPSGGGGPSRPWTRAVRDRGLSEDPVSTMFEDDEEEGPPYHVVALLLNARLATLPPARRPAGAHNRAHNVGHRAGLGIPGDR
jgi:hypothetical protein